jgi:signal transduction histidine kinase
MRHLNWKSTASYVALLAGAYVTALFFSWFFGAGLNDHAYDTMFSAYPAPFWEPEAVVLAIDEATLRDCGGIRGIRDPLARALRILAGIRPKAVAVDVILADRHPDQDAALADALRATPNVVLSSPLIETPAEGAGQETAPNLWEDPLPEFVTNATLGHVSAQPDRDGVTRSILLEQHTGIQRRWALPLEAFRVSRGAAISEDIGLGRGLASKTLSVGGVRIPVLLYRPQRHAEPQRLMRVRFFPPGMPVPRVSLKRLLDDPSQASRLNGKAVFIGLTAQNVDVRDQLFTPLGRLPGIEINAAAYETMARQMFLTDVPLSWEVLISLGLMVAIGLAFRYLPGWWAYGAGVLLLLGSMLIPYAFFTHQRVFPFATSAFVSWFGMITAASYYHLVVRRNLRIEQASRERYQQAMHFVTHEMRTPLSAIQGSSELISRFPLTEEKRKQVALLINSESKRLARMVEIFLNVERLSAGQMELKREAIVVRDMVGVCVERVLPLAERKRIAISLVPISEELTITGDRELMEYACYNLLTNAVKYSPQNTNVTVFTGRDEAQVRIAVQDQGIGMDKKEVKQIFQKFYRTKKAEESGEVGTGIGLSIVQQIVEQHGGRIDVTSQPGRGSCFTVVVPAAAHVASVVERH